jgi:hypothetical protein
MVRALSESLITKLKVCRYVSYVSLAHLHLLISFPSTALDEARNLNRSEKRTRRVRCRSRVLQHLKVGRGRGRNKRRKVFQLVRLGKATMRFKSVQPHEHMSVSRGEDHSRLSLITRIPGTRLGLQIVSGLTFFSRNANFLHVNLVES